MGRFLTLTGLAGVAMASGIAIAGLMQSGTTKSAIALPTPPLLFQENPPASAWPTANLLQPADQRPHAPFYPIAPEPSLMPAATLSHLNASNAIANIPNPANANPANANPPELSAADRDRFQQIMQTAQAQGTAQQPMGEIMQAIAQQLVGSAYRDELLDQSAQETLVTSLTQFDCVLFVEAVLALSRGVAAQDYNPATFVAHIEDQRYRNGTLQNYCSRLHYWSEWIADNEKRGTVRNITAELGGVPLNKSLNFMTQHRRSYPKLAKDDAMFACMEQMEQGIKLLKLDYIPTDRIAAIYGQLQPGDIVAIATDIAGLDVTHTGLAYRQANGNFGFIHASPVGSVVIAKDLQTYTSRVERAIGIIVARPSDAR